MRVLLDSNVWRYLVDHSNVDELAGRAAEFGVTIAVAPTLVDEARGLKDDVVRPRILKSLADARWLRLMPDAFLEAEDIKKAIRHYRPGWIVTQPDLREVRRLHDDWEAPHGGFWSRAGDDAPTPQTNEFLRGKRELELAVQESREIRQRVDASKRLLPDIKLTQVYGTPPPGLPGSCGREVEYWRVPALYFFTTELAIYASPYREWIDSEVDIGAIVADPASLTALWYYEASPAELPRHWLRGSFEFLQAFHKVTTGTPADSALSVYLVDVDAVVSADRNFIHFAQKCRADAPFPVAQSRQIAGGAEGIAELWGALKELGAGA